MYEGSTGPDVIDVRSLVSQGIFHLRPWLHVDSLLRFRNNLYRWRSNGVLLYRGYPIEQLAAKSDFMECCYLLLNGELPNTEEKATFIDNIKHHTMVHEQISNLFISFPRHAHPMSVMIGAVGALSAFYHKDLQIENIEETQGCGRTPDCQDTYPSGDDLQVFHRPALHVSTQRPTSFSENFLHMMFATPCEEYTPSPVIADAMDKIFLLHADHEQNASTSTVRLSRINWREPYACISSGITDFGGPHMAAPMRPC